MLLVLFDIDGTLIHSRGAGSRALETALSEIHGLSGYMERIRLDGKTDQGIVEEVYELAGRVGETVVLDDQFLALFEKSLERELEPQDALNVLPGVEALLNELGQNCEVALGLATGNTEVGARLKLQRAKLAEYFSFGGFGSISSCRTTVIRTAVQAGTEHVAPRPVERVVVIGDTPRDINHGRQAGAATVAVATGRYNSDELSQYEPDLLLEDLTPTPRLLDFLTI